jgi:tripartite-type tricarboxylate transporter receptor subunit TctC
MLEHPIVRRNLIGSTIAGVAAALLPGRHSARAEDPYPSRDVRVIVPFSAGGGTDLVTRLFAQQLGEKYGKAFFVENRAGGGGGSVGSLAVARSNPDGYTLGAGTSSGIQAAAIDPTDYSPLRDLQPIARFGSGTLVVAINPQLPVKTVAELVAYVKAHPGLTYGSSGVGSTNHITGAMLAKVANINLRHIPYRGEGGAALADAPAGPQTAVCHAISGRRPPAAPRPCTKRHPRLRRRPLACSDATTNRPAGRGARPHPRRRAARRRGRSARRPRPPRGR